MKKTPFIHTFLFGIFPVLFLYAHNIKQIPVDALFRPSIFAFIFTVFIWLLFCRFLNDSYRANLIASFCLLLFYSYPWIILDLFGNNVINNS